MKAVILNGANKDDAVLSDVQKIIYDELGAMKWEAESFLLHEIKIAACQGDFGCWIKRPGTCIIKDAGPGIAEAVINSNMVLLLSPLTFGGYSAELKKMADRLLCLISPLFMKIGGEFHHRKRYRRYPVMIGVGILEKTDEESGEIFKKLVRRNALNFHAPYSASEIIVSNEDRESIQAKIRKLFGAKEVRQ